MARTLRRGNRGTDVAELQADLNRYLSPNPALEVDGIFGRGTESAVRAFQQREGLSADGIAGSKTFAALERNAQRTGGSLNSSGGSQTSTTSGGAASGGGAAAPGGIPVIDTGEDLTPIRAEGLTTVLGECAVQIAMTQLHVREVPEGSNDGPQIQAYCRSANKTAPALWCMAFVYWCFGEAAARQGQTHPMAGVPDWAKIYVTGVYAWARDNGKLVDQPTRGDVFCVPGGPEGRTHRHTGIVTDVNGGTVSTVEGNTNNDGSDNGIGVFARTRTASRLDFFRLP